MVGDRSYEFYHDKAWELIMGAKKDNDLGDLISAQRSYALAGQVEEIGFSFLPPEDEARRIAAGKNIIALYARGGNFLRLISVYHGLLSGLNWSDEQRSEMEEILRWVYQGIDNSTVALVLRS